MDKGPDLDERPTGAFPRDELIELIKRLPPYGRLAWSIGRDPSLSASRRGAVMAAAAYLISPIDLVPGVIPVIGQLDDLVVLLIGLRFALAGLSPERRRRHLADAHLTEAALAQDIQALGAMGRWVLQRGADVAMLGLHKAISLGRRSTSMVRRPSAGVVRPHIGRAR